MAELTAEEKRQFDMQRTSLFKGTIAVVVTYGVILFVLSLVGILSEKARQAIFTDGFIFTVTFMAGVILVILMLLIQIFTYKQAPKEVMAGENLVCPEYWELKKTPKDVIAKIADKQAKGMSNYYCQAPTNTGVKPTISTTTDVGKKLQSVADVYNLNSIPPITCDRLYPEYMAYMDQKYFPDEPTKLRKEYIAGCKSATSPVVIDWPAVSP